MTQVCLITQAHIAHNPRLVKEADALSAAGYSVRVVSRQVLPALVERDAGLMRGRDWHHDPLMKVGSFESSLRRARTNVYQMLVHMGLISGIAERALFEDYPQLLRKAIEQPAALYIAHNLEALPVAHAAARKHQASLGFDSEDLHSGEFLPTDGDSIRKRVVDFIETKYLPDCDYVSAPSPQVADALASRYGIPKPLVIYNTFPWEDRDALDGLMKDRRGDGLSLYWYSQTIGLDRGLQDVIRAAGLLDGPFQIHLRGSLSAAVKTELMSLARDCGISEKLFFLATVPPGELLSRAAEHDVGLALETPDAPSRALSVSNKMFLYMLAGLGVATTDIPGQSHVLSCCPAAGFLYKPNDYQEMARQLQKWLSNPSSLLAAKQASLEAAKTRWNWESESRKFVERVSGILGSASAGSPAEPRGLYTSSAALS